MNIDEIRTVLRTFIMEKFEIPADDADFDDDVHLFDYGYVDSFGAVTIIDFIKERFGVEITDMDLVTHSLNTINEVSALIAERV